MRESIITTFVLPLAITASMLPVQGHTAEPCVDQVSKVVGGFKFPGKLLVPEKRTFQKPARYRHSYIFEADFEEDSLSVAFYSKSGATWKLREGVAKKGHGMIVFEEHVEGLAEQTITADMNNWLVLGPFDLSAAKEAHFNFHIQLGEAETGQNASLCALVSIDGSEFYGYKFSGTTCEWSYQTIDLTIIPQLGNVCGKSSVWFAFVPSSPPSAPGGDIGLDRLRLLTFNPGLPPKFIIPMKGALEPVGTYEDLLAHYSPYVIQDLDCTHFGDYITCFHYDSDYVANNNWDNLGADCGEICGSYPPSCHQNLPLPAYVYGSVIETNTHYYLCYALFHPADDFHCNVLHHENDLEGIIVMVFKDGSTYGYLRMVQLQAHWEFSVYVPPWLYPPEEHGIYGTNDDVDTTISCFGADSSHPVVYVEGGGHGIRAKVQGSIDGPYVHYIYRGTAENTTNANETDESLPENVPDWQRVGYDILPISAELWQRRRDHCGAGCVFSDPGNYSGHRFSVQNLGLNFDGNTCMNSGPAHPPWNWNDEFDSPPPGDWFMDSAWYHDWQFNWDETLDLTYNFHTFLFNHLCGDVYYKLGSFDSPSDPYCLKCDVIIPADKGGLSVDPGVEVRFSDGTRITANSPVDADGSTETIRFVSAEYPDRGIRVDGELRLQNGGCIRFPKEVGERVSMRAKH